MDFSFLGLLKFYKKPNPVNVDEFMLILFNIFQNVVSCELKAGTHVFQL